MSKITQDKLSSAHKGFRYTVTMEGNVGYRVITASMWSRGDGRGVLLAVFSCFPREWADHMNCTCGRGSVAMRKLMGLLGEDPHFEMIQEKVDVIMASRFGAASCDTPVRTGYFRKNRARDLERKERRDKDYLIAGLKDSRINIVSELPKTPLTKVGE